VLVPDLRDLAPAGSPQTGVMWCLMCSACDMAWGLVVWC
jgi:hypothetical protein